jgi:predicted DNA-binding WGR domain protein
LPNSRSAEQAAALAHFQHELRMVSMIPEKNRCRFYSLTCQPALWGGVALICHWGRLGTTGRWRAAFYPDRATAGADIVAIIRRRIRHGYWVARWD